MRNFLAVILVSSILSCTSQKPKLSERPKEAAPTAQMDEDFAQLRALRAQIISLATSVSCTNPNDWEISPLGKKACGGPAEYIAYPKKMAQEIEPKIQQYSILQAEYNRKNRIVSDCSMVPAPVGVHCVNGKAVLDKSGATAF